MVAEPSLGAMMLPWRRSCKMALGALAVLLLVWRLAETKEHFTKKDGRLSLGPHDCTENKKREGSKGKIRTLELGFGGNRTSSPTDAAELCGIGLTDVWTSDLGRTTLEGVADEALVRVQGVAINAAAISACAAVEAAISAGDAINACDSVAFRTCVDRAWSSCRNEAISAFDVEISACEDMALVKNVASRKFGPTMWRSWNSLSWTTPEEMFGSAWNGTVGFATCSTTACYGGSDGLAWQYRPIYEMDENYTQVIQEELMDGIAWWTIWRSWSTRGLALLDKFTEESFLYIDIKDTLARGMRQFFGLMSVERTWMCWLATMCSLLAMSHLGLWSGTGPTSWTSTTSLRSTRLAKQRMRVKKVQWKTQLKALLFASWIQCCSGMEGEQAFLQQMTVLATAATNAASAAERAIGLMSSQSTSSSGAGGGQPEGGGLQAAARILKNPESFSGEDPLSFIGWKFAFCSWLSFGDGRFQKCFENLEKLGPEEDVPAYSNIEQELSIKLFAILASYLKGKCFSLVKSFAKSRDGFKLWRALVAEFEPSTRQRSLALAQTLSNYPTFVNSKSTMEQILAYELLVQQFEEASASTYPAELKIATLVRCAGQRLREYLQLTINDKTTYGQLKETMLSYDKACKSWTPESVMKPLQSATASTADHGPQPMEVDRIENKGKGKKGKSKDKGKGWWNYGSTRDLLR
eukprot:s47_g48.t1